MTIDNKFEIGEMVLLKTDIEKRDRLICGISVMLHEKVIRYNLVSGTTDMWHYEMELEKKNGQVNKPGFK